MTQARANTSNEFRAGAVRYLVGDVDRAVAFYSEHLGLSTQTTRGPVAMVVNGPLTLWLSGPESSGARPLPDGGPQGPGGSNRLVLEVADLGARVAALRQQGVRFRNTMQEGPGGKQIQVEDPDGNPIELFQPASTPPP